MFFTAVTGFTALHRAAQRGDDAEVASLIEKVRFFEELLLGLWIFNAGNI